MDAASVHRGTWLSILRYCVGQENGGVIQGARLWNDRKWQQIAGVTLEEVQSVNRIYGFDGDDLRLEFYPAASEVKVKHNRRVGKAGGKASALARAQASAQAPAQAGASTEGKGREGKVMEGTPRACASGTSSGDIPTEAEFVAAFALLAIPEDYLRDQFAYFEGNNAWLDKQGGLKQWPILVHRWWVRDCAAYGTNGAGSEKNSAGSMSLGQRLFGVDKELADVKQRLDERSELNQEPVAADVAQERELKKKRAEMLREQGGKA